MSEKTKRILTIVAIVVVLSILIYLIATGSVSGVTSFLNQLFGIETPATDTDGGDAPSSVDPGSSHVSPNGVVITEDGTYDTKFEVALYIHLFGHLPSNYMTKDEAEAKGWSGGALDKVIPGKAIGGDVFTNYQKILPTKKGRTYTECDIDTIGAKARGAKRIVFSNDGLVYYTDDHYESFTLLYGDPNK